MKFGWGIGGGVPDGGRDGVFGEGVGPDHEADLDG
jgi:hypothetical protein